MQEYPFLPTRKYYELLIVFTRHHASQSQEISTPPAANRGSKQFVSHMMHCIAHTELDAAWIESFESVLWINHHYWAVGHQHAAVICVHYNTTRTVVFYLQQWNKSSFENCFVLTSYDQDVNLTDSFCFEFESFSRVFHLCAKLLGL